MRQRVKIPAAAFSILVLATTIISLLQRPVQAQTTPALSIPGAIFGGTKNVNSTQGPVPVCYTSGGLACDGKFHVVSDNTSASFSCGASTC
jgi:hypothetical protein